jgi:hypothetical protein
MAPHLATAALAFVWAEVVADGTVGGTKLKINGKEIKNLTSPSISVHNNKDSPGGSHVPAGQRRQGA